jgi:hypothetical protein
VYLVVLPHGTCILNDRFSEAIRIYDIHIVREELTAFRPCSYYFSRVESGTLYSVAVMTFLVVVSVPSAREASPATLSMLQQVMVGFPR